MCPMGAPFTIMQGWSTYTNILAEYEGGDGRLPNYSNMWKDEYHGRDEKDCRCPSRVTSLQGLLGENNTTAAIDYSYEGLRIGT